MGIITQTQSEFNKLCIAVHSHKQVYERELNTSWERIRAMLVRQAIRSGFDANVLINLDNVPDTIQ